MIHEVDIESPDAKKFGTGGNKRVYPPDGGEKKYKKIGCNVQAASGRTVLEYSGRGVRVTHSIYFDEELTVGREDRIKFGDAYFSIADFKRTYMTSWPFVIHAEEKV